jgi:hypothetical protein
VELLVSSKEGGQAGDVFFGCIRSSDDVSCCSELSSMHRLSMVARDATKYFLTYIPLLFKPVIN